jgi:hypothetical protein
MTLLFIDRFVIWWGVSMWFYTHIKPDDSL